MRDVILRDGVGVGPSYPLLLLAGPCVIESADHCHRLAAAIAPLAAELGLGYVFKASFDKANRSAVQSYRGPGLEAGLQILAAVGREHGVPVVTDVHEAWQCAPAAAAVDLLQIPAFLSRQTDLLLAAAATGRPVNLKKAQFAAPGDLAHGVGKLVAGGVSGILLTERGTTFGYHNLVVDMRGLVTMRELGWPVCFDGTHSVQLPAAAGGSSGGDRRFVPPLVRAATAVGIDALFLEVHDDPDRARCDGPNMVPLAELRALLEQVVRLREAVR
ncbi:MAG: 3-deoxy-8-phosphooctulonate synthase [Fimbriimonadaceae bacterium]|nr:3-deoxy-8-phosphooctulonate synthase [Fimbriimonadaceae bacterium]